MIPKFYDYLDSLGLKGDLVGRIEKIYDFFSEINSEEIKQAVPKPPRIHKFSHSHIIFHMSFDF